jgi:hypothetical protein
VIFGRSKQKIVASGEEPPILVPIVLEPIQIEVAPLVIPIDVEATLVAVRVDALRTKT